MLTQLFIVSTICYLLGSIPFSFLIAFYFKGVDLRYEGEGNVGARNVWHLVGKKYGILAALLDAGKGYGAYLVGRAFHLDLPWLWIAGVAVIFGHGFPVFLKGRGGKGAAAALGFLLGLNPLGIVLSGGLMGVFYLLSKNFHLALGGGMAAIPFLWLFLFHRSLEETISTIGFLLLLGIKRLIDEPHMKKIREISGW